MLHRRFLPLFFVVFCLLNSLVIAQACPPEATQVQVLDRFGGNQWVDAFTPVSDGNNNIYPLSTLGPYNPTAYSQYVFHSTGAVPAGPLCYWANSYYPSTPTISPLTIVGPVAGYVCDGVPTLKWSYLLPAGAISAVGSYAGMHGQLGYYWTTSGYFGAPMFGGTWTTTTPAPQLGMASPSTLIRGVTSTITLFGNTFGPELGGCLTSGSGGAGGLQWVSTNIPNGLTVAGNNADATQGLAGNTLTLDWSPYWATAVPLGVYPIAVSNNTGGWSNSLPLAVVNPPPNTTSVSLLTWEADQPPAEISVSGSHLNGPMRDGYALPDSTTATLDGHALDVAGIYAGWPYTVFAPALRLAPADPATVLLWTTAGSKTLTITNPPPGGGSDAYTINIVNPAPIATQVDPSVVFIETNGTTSISVQGSRFMPDSTVSVNGVPVPTTYVYGGLLTAALPRSLTSQVGVLDVVVSTPAPGGGTSATLTLPVQNAVPVVSGVSTSTLLVGHTQNLTITGTGFNPNTYLVSNGSSSGLTITAWTQTTLDVTVDASLLPSTALGSNLVIEVINPPPGGGVAAIYPWVINPAPTLSSVAPTSLVANTSQSVTLSGTDFNDTTGVLIPGCCYPTISSRTSTSLVATIEPWMVPTPGSTIEIKAYNPGPYGGDTIAISIPIEHPLPTLKAASLPALAGNVTQNVTLTGTGFFPSSTVLVNGSPNGVTVYGQNSTELYLTLDASILSAIGGTAAITVTNPAPGGGTSSILNLPIENAVPGFAQISTNTLLVGLTQNVTITGTGFNANTYLASNGNPTGLTVTAWTPTTLDVTIDASVLPFSMLGNYFYFEIVNPPPGGGSTGTGNLALPVVNPVPTLASIAPTILLASTTQTVTLTGTNFNESTIVVIPGCCYPTITGRTATTLIATIDPWMAPTAGATVDLEVHNPSIYWGGGGTSNTLTLAVEYPLPTVTSASIPALAGNVTQNVALTGTGFFPTSTVLVNGSPNGVTVYAQSSTELYLTLDASILSAIGGTAAITVTNPAPGGGTSSVFNLSIDNAVPTFGTISPNTALIVGLTQNVTITGTGFNANTYLASNGNPSGLTVTAWTPTTLDVTIDASVLPTSMLGNYFYFEIVNPPPGGGSTGYGNLYLGVVNPVPTLASTTPTTLLASTTQTITLTGTNFNESTIVVIPGCCYPAVTSRTSTTLVATIDPWMLPTPGVTVDLAAYNPPSFGWDGGISNTLPLAVDYPVPTVTTASLPALAGNVTQSVTLTGTGFFPTSTVLVNGSSNGVTIYGQSSTELYLTLDASILSAIGGTAAITVTNPAPGGGTSSVFNLPIENAAPMVYSVSVTEFIVATTQNFTIGGTGFNSGTTVVANGSTNGLTVTAWTPTTLDVTIDASLLPVSLLGNYFFFEVHNPAPGGGSSGIHPVWVVNPTPTLTSVAPTTLLAGTTQTLTLTGAGFNDSSTVYLLNGWMSWSPTIVSRTPTTLVVSIEPEMVPNHGTAVQISVGNPYPWGGSSAAINVDVLNPVPTIGAVYPGALLAATYNNIAITGTNINSTTEVRINGSTAGVTISTASADGIIVEIAPNVIPPAGGVATVALYNPPPGGGNSNNFQLTISTPQITLSSAAPNELVADTTQSLTLTGTGFTPSSEVLANGVATGLTITARSATSIDVTVDASVVPDADEFVMFTVSTPGPGSASSNALFLRTLYAVPTVTGCTPNPLTAASLSTVTLTGSHFSPASVVTVNGYYSAQPMTVTSTSLTFELQAWVLSGAGTASIQVSNPMPGGGASSPLNVPVDNPMPTLTAITPSEIIGGQYTYVTLSGSGFTYGGTVRFNGSTTGVFIVSVATDSIGLVLDGSVVPDVAGTSHFEYSNPAPGGGSTGLVPIAVINPTPSIYSASNSIVANTTFSVVLTGTGFNALTTLLCNGSSTGVTITGRTSSTLDVTFDPTLVGAFGGGWLNVTASNPLPGGGTSNTISFQVENPLPTTSAISPSCLTTYAPSQTFTLTGSGFNEQSTVQMYRPAGTFPNGDPNGTVYYSAGWEECRVLSRTSTTITATLPNTFIVQGSNTTVRVVNPYPGGGTSGGINIWVSMATPSLSTVTPNVLTPGLAQTVVLTGTGFNNLTYARVNGSEVGVTTSSGGYFYTLTVTISASVVGTSGAPLSIDVVNPCSGGTSNALSVAVQYPAIVASSSTPTQFPFWTPPSSIDIVGSGFLAGTTTATIDGITVPVVITSDSSLTIAGAASLLGTIGTHTLVVSNPTPGGGSAQIPFQSLDPAPTIVAVTPFEVSTSTADTPITILANPTTSLATYSAAGLLVELDGSALATTPGNSDYEIVAWIPAAYTGSAAVRSLTIRNPAPSTAGASPSFALPIVGPSVAQISPGLIGSLPSQTGPVVLSIFGNHFSSASSVVVADGEVLATTWVNEFELSAVLPEGHPARVQTGGAAIFVRNTPTSYSNAVGLEIDDHENYGTISTRPETINAGTVFDLRIEECFPYAPFILFVDVVPIPPFVPWPDANANLVLSVIPSPSTALLDGTGLFGPYIPVTFDASGGFTLPGITAPSPLFGIPFRLQAAYPDPFAPGGFRFTHARISVNL